MSTQTGHSLSGKCAIVTGAAKRIGSSIAELLHANGVDIAVHYHSSARQADELCIKLNAQRRESARSFAADISRAGAASALIASVVDWHGGLNFLINNASSFFPTPLGEISEDDWSDLMGSNLKGPLFLAQEAAPHLTATSGSIVNIIDIHASKPLRNHVVYGSAKAGLAMLTKSLARELAPDVRVNGVAPGAIAWPNEGLSAETRKKIVSQIPLGRTGEPKDIAECVLFLVRDASYSTGSVIAIDGGRSAGW